MPLVNQATPPPLKILVVLGKLNTRVSGESFP